MEAPIFFGQIMVKMYNIFLIKLGENWISQKILI